MTARITRRHLLGAGAAAAGLMLTTGRAFASGTYDLPSVTLVVPFDTGGSADRMARVTAPFIAEELGVPVNVINRPGGGGIAGHTWFLTRPADGSTYLVTAPTPHLANQVLTGLGSFAWEDYAFLNAQWRDYYMLSVNAEQPYKSFDDLVAALGRPGEVSAGILRGDGGHLSILLMMDALGLPVENIRLVSFDGGGAARTALAGNQVSMSIISAQGTEPIRDAIRPLAVFTGQPLPNWNAPTVTEALAIHNTDMKVLDADVRTVMCHASLPEAHPERLSVFMAAYERALSREDCKAALADVSIGGEWHGMAATTEIVNRNYEILASVADRLQE